MKNTSSNQQSSSDAPVGHGGVQSFLARLRDKISYLTLPLIVVATMTEVVILVIGWRYEQMVCVPQGMGVLFMGIGPIGAVILSVELLKLPLAMWTASRRGWRKWVMVAMGLPLICVLTFILVRDMAVYEMTVATRPAGELLEQATAEETRIVQLNAELGNQGVDEAKVKALIELRKADRERKRTELAAKQAAFKSEHEASLALVDAARKEAVTPTDYEKKEFADCEARQAAIAAQFASDTEQLTKSITDLRTRRETELARTTKDSVDWEARRKSYEADLAKWNAEEARISNAYQQAMLVYTNAKNDYDKAKAEYDSASTLKRQIMIEPVSPGLPPVREVNGVAKPAPIDARPSALVEEFDRQIKSKEDELAAANTKRRERIAQVEADVRNLRKELERRAGTKTETMDQKRDALLAAYAAKTRDWDAETKQIDQEFNAAVLKDQGILKNKRPLDAVRAEIDAARKKADSLYEERMVSLKGTQVYRIATDVEMVRGLILGEKPASITLSAKERGDLITDQISMVRIWVYPIFAFIVAYLPTLMVEVGFSTIFKTEKLQPNYRLGWFGRRLHALYTRAGKHKILRAERMAAEVSTQMSARDAALAGARHAHEQLAAAREAEALAAKAAAALSAQEHAAELQRKEDAWVVKFAGLADSLNRLTAEKDALRDLQKSEIERQVQLRQDAWTDRLSQLQKELNSQRTARETERAAMVQEHHRQLMEATEESKLQVIEVRRQMADAELARVEAGAKMAHDLKVALAARDTAESQARQQAEALAQKLSQSKEEAARDLEKAVRQEKSRADRQQFEHEKALRQQSEDLARQLKQREQELSLQFDARLAEAQAKADQDARRREADAGREFEARIHEVETRWAREAQQRDEVAQIKLKQREQQLQSQLEAARHECRQQAGKELQAREAELARLADARLRDAEARFVQELARKDDVAQLKLQQQEQELSAFAEARQKQELLLAEEAALVRTKQREQEFAAKIAAREAELRAQSEQELRNREMEWERSSEVRTRAAEARLAQEAQQKEELVQMKFRQREQQLLAQLEARLADGQVQSEQELRRREMELERQLDAKTREADARLKQELQQKELAAQAKLKQREQELSAKADARHAELQAQWEQDLRGHEQEWERNAEARSRAIESRWAAETQQKEELFQSKSRQQAQQWQAQLDAAQAAAKQREQQLLGQAETRLSDAVAQSEQELRRREMELERQLDTQAREADIRLKQELGQKEELFQAKLRQQVQQSQAQLDSVQAAARQREQESAAQSAAQVEARLIAAQAAWDAESEKKLRAAVEPVKALLARAEKERDEARQAAAGAARQAQDLEKKLTEVSSFLNGWKK